MTARQQWKIAHRLWRISIREQRKAAYDLLAYGTGSVFVYANGEVKHILLTDSYRAFIEKT